MAVAGGRRCGGSQRVTFEEFEPVVIRAVVIRLPRAHVTVQQVNEKHPGAWTVEVYPDGERAAGAKGFGFSADPKHYAQFCGTHAREEVGMAVQSVVNHWKQRKAAS